MRDAWVASSWDEAAAVYGPEVMSAYHYYWQNQLPEFRGMAESEFTLENVAKDRIIMGDPETCTEFHRWQRRRVPIRCSCGSAMPTRADRHMRTSCRRSSYLVTE